VLARCDLNRAERLAFNYFPREFEDREFFRRVAWLAEDAARHRESLGSVVAATGEILYRDECMSGGVARKSRIPIPISPG
jgi:hypothetical protein